MTSHEFAQKLLKGPDLPICTPVVIEYSDDEERGMAAPTISEVDGEYEGQPNRLIVIMHATQP